MSTARETNGIVAMREAVGMTAARETVPVDEYDSDATDVDDEEDNKAISPPLTCPGRTMLHNTAYALHQAAPRSLKALCESQQMLRCSTDEELVAKFKCLPQFKTVRDMKEDLRKLVRHLQVFFPKDHLAEYMAFTNAMESIPTRWERWAFDKLVKRDWAGLAHPHKELPSLTRVWDPVKKALTEEFSAATPEEVEWIGLKTFRSTLNVWNSLNDLPWEAKMLPKKQQRRGMSVMYLACRPTLRPRRPQTSRVLDARFLMFHGFDDDLDVVRTHLRSEEYVERKIDIRRSLKRKREEQDAAPEVTQRQRQEQDAIQEQVDTVQEARDSVHEEQTATDEATCSCLLSIKRGRGRPPKRTPEQQAAINDCSVHSRTHRAEIPSPEQTKSKPRKLTPAERAEAKRQKEADTEREKDRAWQQRTAEFSALIDTKPAENSKLAIKDGERVWHQPGEGCEVAAIPYLAAGQHFAVSRYSHASTSKKGTLRRNHYHQSSNTDSTTKRGGTAVEAQHSTSPIFSSLKAMLSSDLEPWELSNTRR